MKNKYEIRGDIVVIFLKTRKGKIYESIIDLDDFDKVNEYDVTWYMDYNKRTRKRYCSTTLYLGTYNGKPKYKRIRLHKLIIDLKNQHTDHINGNSLDNRKCNLSDTSARENLYNRKRANRNTSTGVRNVSYIRATGKYLVQLQINGKNTRFGEFDDLEEAKKCAEKMREKYYPKVKVVD